MAIYAKKKKSVVDEILAPEKTPVTSTPPAVPVQDMAAPVTGTATDQLLTVEPTAPVIPPPTVQPTTAVDQVLTAPATATPPVTTAAATPTTATAAGAGPGPSTPPETAPVYYTRNVFGKDVQVPADAYIEDDPFANASTVDIQLAMQEAGFSPIENAGQLPFKIYGVDENGNVAELPNAPSTGGVAGVKILAGAIAKLSETLAWNRAVLTDPNSSPEAIEAAKQRIPQLEQYVSEMQGSYWKIRNAYDTRLANAGGPDVSGAGDVNIPDSGTGGTPGQGAVGDTGTGGTGTGGTGTGGIDAGTPPETKTAPFEEGELTKTAQEKLADFERTDPTQHPGGMSGWLEERNRLRSEAAGETTTTTPTTTATTTTAQQALSDFEKTDPTQYPGGVAAWTAERNRLRRAAENETTTTVSQGDKISGETYADSFLKDLIDKGFELSPEEEATIRREVAGATQKALSGLSARGLGRGSEAAGVIAQGEFETVRQIGEAKARVRKEGTEAALKAASMFEDRLNSDRNYQIAVAGQNLEALKNAQGVSFQERAMQLKTMETKAAIAQMEKEFGLKLDELEFKKFIETGELNAKIFDIEGTQRLQEVKIVNDYWLAKSDQEIQKQLGISKLELERWMAGEQIDLTKLEMTVEQIFKQLDIQIEGEKIKAALAAAQDGGDTFQIVAGILAIGAELIGG